MKKTILLILIAASGIVMFAGCQSGVAQKEGFVADPAYEADLIKQIGDSREICYQDIQNLKVYFARTGSHQKLRWASKEVDYFSVMPKYDYLMAAETATAVADPNAPKVEASNAVVAALAPDAHEVDLVEKLADSRAIYYKNLNSLKEYYTNAGDSQRLRLVSKEITYFEKAPKYKYLMPAETAGLKLQAIDSIPQADALYEKGMNLYTKAFVVPEAPNKVWMRQALVKFNEIIDEYPTSDKVDDAAYRAAQLYENFCDYSLAATYYQRAYLWNDTTPYPARYDAARILDTRLKKRNEALVLYKASVQNETAFPYFNGLAQQRIQELTLPEQR